MAKSGTGYSAGVDYNTNFAKGQLHLIDNFEHGDPAIAGILTNYHSHAEGNRHSLLWQRTVRWIENVFFMAGRHYTDDILMSRIASNTSGDLSLIREVRKNIPQPTNDLLGRYTETNVALLTENRPRPRVTAKSDKAEDQEQAKLSEFTLEYLWEALDMPQKHRQIARILMATGVCWLEICYDPTQPRRMAIPKMQKAQTSVVPPGIPGAPAVPLPGERLVTVKDEFGRPVYDQDVEYGDLTANIVTPFELHMPPVHWWKGSNNSVDTAGWIMREYYMPKDVLQDKYTAGGRKMGLTKSKGWFLKNLDKVSGADVQNLPVWWWERLGQMVEGAGTTFYVGNPELWKDYTVVRVFDRKPSKTWPRGRTIIVAGGQVIYDSPKDIGARAYDPRWPERWHPYTIFRWEPLASTDVYCRSLLSKLLPKIKRVNSIDTAMIMWRRTVPYAGWIAPKGAVVVEDQWAGGRGGMIYEWDPRRTNNNPPQPIVPPPFPEAALREREQQIAEMEAIAGTEEILRGQRPTGVNSAAMIDILRKQALASRSAILQGWDESLEYEGSVLLQEVIKNIRDDVRYAERIRILAREKASRLTIQNFSGFDVSDNVTVRVDTASMALVSKEAREAKAIEFLQYAPSLMSIPYVGLRDAIVEELGFSKSLQPQGPDVDRAKKLISWIKQERYDRVVPFQEDDPYVFFELLVNEQKSDEFWDLNQDQQTLILRLIDAYRMQIQIREEQQLRMQIMMAQIQGAAKGGGGGGEIQIPGVAPKQTGNK